MVKACFKLPSLSLRLKKKVKERLIISCHAKEEYSNNKVSSVRLVKRSGRVEKVKDDDDARRKIKERK